MSVLQDDLLKWTGEAQFVFDADIDSKLRQDELHATLSHLFAADAWPGSGFSYLVRNLDAEQAFELMVLHDLAEHGLTRHIVEDAEFSSWELTDKGLQLLRPVSVLTNPSPALACDPSIPLQDRTSWQHWHSLVSDGWVATVCGEKQSGLKLIGKVLVRSCM